jgi:hypothetical protein
MPNAPRKARAQNAALAAFILAAASCGGSSRSAMPIDRGGVDPEAPGVSCGKALRYDQARGCVDETADGRGGDLVVRYTNEMGSGFLLIGATFALDSRLVFQWRDPDDPRHPPGKEDTAGFRVYEGTPPPGEHLIEAILVYRGVGDGVFEYLRKYKFTARSRHHLETDPRTPRIVHVVGHEAGEPTTPLEERPNIRWATSDQPR